MPKAKTHLNGLVRINPHEKAREAFLRLDMNEGVPGLPADFLKKVFAEVDVDYLARYPEYQTLQGQIATHNHLSPGNVVLSNGSDGAIKYIFDAYVSPGDKILLTDPTFAMYPVYCQMFDAELIMVEYRPDLSFPMEEFITRISSDIRMAVVVNPNNPTGYALTQNELLIIISEAAKHNVLMIVDEAYFYFYPETVIQQIKNYKNLIVLRTFSKLCGIATVRLGYAAACPEIIEILCKVRPTYDVNGIAVLFGQKILESPDIIPGLIKAAKEGKNYLLQKLSEGGIEYREGAANFVLIKCNGKAADIVRKLAEAKILVTSGFRNAFLHDYIRVTIGNREVMEQFWKSFKKIWHGRPV